MNDINTLFYLTTGLTAQKMGDLGVLGWVYKALQTKNSLWIVNQRGDLRN
jgi:hypothetical protein